MNQLEWLKLWENGLVGGVESVIMNYYRNIDRSKIQFDFLCDSDSTNIPYEEIEKLGGQVILIPPYQKIFRYRKELKNIFEKNQYKIVHSNINTMSVFPLEVAKKCGVPIRIAHSHSTSNIKEWKKNILKNIFRLFSKTYANVYFACSEKAGRFQFGNKAFNEGKVKIINNAIDLNKFKFNIEIRKEKRKELGIDETKKVIGHIGRFVTQKNHEFLIDVFYEICKKDDNVMLLLVGQGPLENKIKDKVTSLGIDSKVKFLGQRNDANELYQAFDLFVLPSLYEGLPVVGIEAQAAGLQCLFSDDMTKETKVLNATRFLSLNEGKVRWADEIIKLLNNERKDTSNEVIKSGFDIVKESKKLENIYLKF